MNCFVIMPFAGEFDDVYAIVKTSVEAAFPDRKLRCFRLDESRPAGRITGRLVDELRSAALCVADLTGLRPNIMWETGFAMALGKPVVIITQDGGQLPFDIIDMQCITYDRNRLTRSLAEPLKNAVIDTLGAFQPQQHVDGAADRGELRAEIHELKAMLRDAVLAFSPPPRPAPTATPDPRLALEGNWINQNSQSHLYARFIDGELVVPYCYQGNGELTGVYYGFRRTGEHWFARFAWTKSEIAGFTFLRPESADALSGAWWMDSGAECIPDSPEMSSGVPIRLKRLPGTHTAAWAARFLADVGREGLAACLARHRVESLRPTHED